MEFSALVGELLDGYFANYPASATEIGKHDHDGAWPDLTDAGTQARLAFLRDAQQRLAAFDEGALSRDEQIDRRILLQNLAAVEFFEADLDEASWNPLSYVYLFGGGLFALLARDFAPLPTRLASAAARLRGLPDALDAARARLSAGSARRGISAFHAERAIATMPGVADLARSAAREAEGLDDERARGELRAAADEAIAALAAFGTWLREELLPTATGDFRLGAELYRRKFRHALKTELTPEELEARATVAFGEVRSEMTRLARQLWPQWIGEEPLPAKTNELVRRVLDAIAAEHPAGEDLLDVCRAENARIEDYIRGIDLIGLADEPLEIIWTPEFLRAFGGAMLIPPGPLDRGLSSFFAITPMPDDWTDEQRESYLREDNSRMLRLLTIHEAVPGHYLQLAFSNRCPSLARAIFASGVFAEGWAVYVTQVMMDVGYGAADPALLLMHWKFYLRSITNTLMDIRIHAGSMDRGEAMHMMVVDAFQEESEAANKWDRARLSSTQLCEYFLGSVEMTELEREARRRAAAAGDEFVYRPFLESVLAHGTPSMPVIRDILFG